MDRKIATILPFILLLPIIFIVSACSSSNQGTMNGLNKNQRADQSFSFYNSDKGKDSRWDVNFSDGEISSLYKDGERIPDDEIDNYKEMIYDKLDNLKDKSKHITIDMSGFKADMHKFKVDMQKLKEELKDKKFEVNFDSEAFHNGMKNLSEELSKLKDKKIKIEFDSDKFKDEMENLKNDMDIHVNIKYG